MNKTFCLVLIICLITTTTNAQNDTATRGISATFERIAAAVKDYQPDTSAAPDDKVTRKIIELRNLRGGFNINEAIQFKIEEDRQKKEIPAAELDQLSAFFTTGLGKRWLDNATNWIYRRNFTYAELKQLVKFYKTPAGQKMAINFPIVMIETVKAGDWIKEFYNHQQR